MIAGPFHHLAIQVRDLEGLTRWYQELFGLPLLRRWPGNDGRDRSVWLDLGAHAFLALERCEGIPAAGEPWSRETPGLFLLALRMPLADRADWEHRLAARGIAVERRTSWTIFFRDPEGNRLGLSSHPDGVEGP